LNHFLITCPVVRVCHLDAGLTNKSAPVCIIFNAVAKLPLYIVACAVLCKLKLILGAYCMGVW